MDKGGGRRGRGERRKGGGKRRTSRPGREAPMWRVLSDEAYSTKTKKKRENREREAKEGNEEAGEGIEEAPRTLPLFPLDETEDRMRSLRKSCLTRRPPSQYGLSASRSRSSSSPTSCNLNASSSSPSSSSISDDGYPSTNASSSTRTRRPFSRRRWWKSRSSRER
jgi:hypothetical protein